LGGDITVESELGKGTKFRITLESGPLEGVKIYDTAPSEALLPRHRPKHPQEIRLPGAKILLVEDGESNRDLVELVLREAGAEVVSAENGEQGVDIALRERFDLIFMDVQMPVMDGFTATRRLRELNCELPIIALTAHAMRGDKERCLDAGFTGYLSKPIEIDELLVVASDAFRGKLQGHLTRDGACVVGATPSEPDRVPCIESTLPVERPEFRRIVNGFVEKLSVKLDAIDAALRMEDFAQIAELAHWLKGAGGTMGFDCFTDPARRLEQQARHNDLVPMQLSLEELQSLAGRIAVPV
jgi:CheY-like chemotaxis protein